MLRSQLTDTQLQDRLQDPAGGRAGGSLRAFREALIDPKFWEKGGEQPPSFSLETIRRYHTDQEPRASYLLAVTERFDVNACWLLTGEPEGLRYMEDVRREASARFVAEENSIWPHVLEAVPELAGWPNPARVLFLDTLDHLSVSYKGFWEIVLVGPARERRFEALAALAQDLFGLVNLQYHNMKEDITVREFTQYLVATLHAIQLRIPEPGEGTHIYNRFNTLSPEFREDVTASLAQLEDGADRAAARLDGKLTEDTPSRWTYEGE